MPIDQIEKLLDYFSAEEENENAPYSARYNDQQMRDVASAMGSKPGVPRSPTADNSR